MFRAPLILVAVPLLLGSALHDPPESAAPASTTVNCLSLDRVLSRHKDGPQSLRFEMNNGAVYRNELPAGCPPLERANEMDILAFDLTGSQVCRGDRFRVADPAEAGAVGLRARASCRLGRFVLVDEPAERP